MLVTIQLFVRRFQLVILGTVCLNFNWVKCRHKSTEAHCAANRKSTAHSEGAVHLNNGDLCIRMRQRMLKTPLAGSQCCKGALGGLIKCKELQSRYHYLVDE